MQIVIHVSKHYDWEPLPTNVQPLEEDIKAMRVKPMANGTWQMKVIKVRDTYTQISLNENEIIGKMLFSIIRENDIITRKEAVAKFVRGLMHDGHAHSKWMKLVEVHDDGPQEDFAKSLFNAQVTAGNIAPDDLPALMDAYLEPVSSDGHAEHMHARFKIHPDTVAAQRALLAGDPK